MAINGSTSVNPYQFHMKMGAVSSKDKVHSILKWTHY